MRIPTVEKCLCGIDLRVGSAIIGVLYFIGNLSQTISFSVEADNADTNGQSDNKATYITSALVCCMMTVATGMLLYGIYKERQGLLRLWLMVYSVMVCANVLILFIGSIVAFAASISGAGAGLLVWAIIYFLFNGYCLVVIYSYYLSLSGVQPGTV